jgi:hypothetical protein
MRTGDDADEIAKQQAAVRDLLEWLDRQPVDACNDSISSADHDLYLYRLQEPLASLDALAERGEAEDGGSH